MASGFRHDAGSASLSATFPSAPNEGNLLIAAVSGRSGQSNPSITGWTLDSNANYVETDATYRRSTHVFYKVAGASESSTVTASWGSGSGTSSIVIAEYTGVDGNFNAAGSTGSGTASSNDFDTGSIDAGGSGNRTAFAIVCKKMSTGTAETFTFDNFTNDTGTEGQSGTFGLAVAIGRLDFTASGSVGETGNGSAGSNNGIHAVGLSFDTDASGSDLDVTQSASEAITVTEGQATVDLALDAVQSASEVLTLTEGAAIVDLALDAVQAATEALTLTEGQATVDLALDAVQAASEAITLTTPQATVQLGSDLDAVQSASESIVVTEGQATVDLALDAVQAASEALTLTTPQATVDLGADLNVTQAASESIVLTEGQATVDLALEAVQASSEAITLTTPQATVDLTAGDLTARIAALEQQAKDLEALIFSRLHI